MRVCVLLVLGLALAGGLRRAHAADFEVRAAAATAEVETGTPLVLEATLANTGEEALEVFLPLHVPTVPFPTWVLRHEDGRLFTPAPPMFQSMVKRGLQGEILRLEPGAVHSFATEVVRVLPYDEGMGRAAPTQLAPTSLPPGRYDVHARYEKPDDHVPFAGETRGTVQRQHAGLWTGRVTSARLAVVVREARRFAVTLEAPETVTAGDPYAIRVRLRNGTDVPLAQDVALVLSVGTKAHGTGALRFLVGPSGARLARSVGATSNLTLAPGDEQEMALDLSAFTYVRDRGAATEALGLYDLLGTGRFHLGARVLDAQDDVIAEGGLFRTIRDPEPSRAVGGLALRLEASGPQGEDAQLTVTLVNEGKEAVYVPAGLRWPHQVSFRVERGTAEARYAARGRAPRGRLHLLGDAWPNRRATLPAPLAWDAGRFEHEDEGRSPAIALLAPGAYLTRTFRLGALLAGRGDDAVDPGVLHVTAFWRNVDSGVRLGLNPPMVVGFIQSPRVEIGASAR